MYSNNNNNQSNQWSGTTELILQPQKLAFDSEINLEKQYNSFEYTTHQQNKLKDLLHYQFNFEPDIYQLPGRINYKSNKINLIAEDYLPSVKMDSKVIKKIQSLLRDGLNKQFFLNGSSFESSSHDLVHQTFYLDKVSFDFEDSFEKSFYGRQEYSLTCFCIGDVSRSMKPSKIMQEQMKEAIKGISSFQGIDFSELEEYQYRKTDLLYLNHFRIFLFFESFANQKDQFKIHRYLYYPRINFTAQLISQPFRLVSTPIAAFLTQKLKNSDLTQKEIAKRRNLVRYGFLSLDRNSRMIPLHASDDYCVQIPLVGVWTYGIQFSEDEQLEHSDKRFVWSLLAEFVKNKTIAQRFTYNQQQKTFILAVFNLDRSVKYYEICIQENLDDEDESENLYSQQENLNESSCQSIKRNWCMIKNYSNSIDQQQIQMNYSNDIASKLSVEYPFRFSQKMIVNQFDDEEFFKSIKQQQMKQSQVVSQQQQQLQLQQTYNQQQNNQQINTSNTINNKQTVKRNISNSTPNNNNNKQRHNQPNNQNMKNVDSDETETQNQTINSNNQYNNNLVTIKSQILELQNKQEDFFQESQKSVQSASFANNQTFSQNLHLQVQQAENATHNTNTDQGLKLPPAAERIIQNQQEQINKMNLQIQQLQEALKQFQSSNTSRQFIDNQSQYSYPLSPQSQSQIIQNPPPLNYNQVRNMNHPMYKNYPPIPPYYYDQYHFYPPHPQMGPHQYPPYPHGPISEHPYNMYHRAPYYMQESYISGDGKSSKVGMINNLMNNNGNFNNFGVDAISDIQSIKKEDDTQSEASNQNVLNNFNNPQKNGVVNMNQQFENRSFSNNNTMGEVNVNAIKNMENQNIINNFMQQNQNAQINQSGQSAQSLQLVQQNSLQSINNQSLQDQSNSSNNDSKKHIREESLVNQIQKQISNFGIENTFQFKEDGNASVKGGRKSEFQFDVQQNQNDSNQLSEKSSLECSQDQYSKYSAQMYYGDDQKLQKQNEQEKIISVRPSIDLPPSSKFSHKQQDSLNQLHLSQIKLNQNNSETNNNNMPYENFNTKPENKICKSPARMMNEENQIKLKQMEKNVRELESEDTFTIDEIVNLKMKTDFFDSIKKAPCTSASNKGKENNNNINTFSIKNSSNFNNNTTTTNYPKTSNTPQSSSSNCQSSSSTKMQIPTIKQPSLIDSDDSDNDEMKEIQKRYKNYIGI